MVESKEYFTKILQKVHSRDIRLHAVNFFNRVDERVMRTKNGWVSISDVSLNNNGVWFPDGFLVLFC